MYYFTPGQTEPDLRAAWLADIKKNGFCCFGNGNPRALYFARRDAARICSVGAKTKEAGARDKFHTSGALS